MCRAEQDNELKDKNPLKISCSYDVKIISDDPSVLDCFTIHLPKCIPRTISKAVQVDVEAETSGNFQICLFSYQTTQIKAAIEVIPTIAVDFKMYCEVTAIVNRMNVELLPDGCDLDMGVISYGEEKTLRKTVKNVGVKTLTIAVSYTENPNFIVNFENNKPVLFRPYCKRGLTITMKPTVKEEEKFEQSITVTILNKTMDKVDAKFEIKGTVGIPELGLTASQLNIPLGCNLDQRIDNMTSKKELLWEDLPLGEQGAAAWRMITVHNNGTGNLNFSAEIEMTDMRSKSMGREVFHLHNAPSIKSGKPTYIIQSDEDKQDIYIGFLPAEERKYTADVFVRSKHGSKLFRIDASSSLYTLEILTDAVRFGCVEYGEEGVKARVPLKNGSPTLNRLSFSFSRYDSAIEKILSIISVQEDFGKIFNWLQYKKNWKTGFIVTLHHYSIKRDNFTNSITISSFVRAVLGSKSFVRAVLDSE